MHVTRVHWLTACCTRGKYAVDVTLVHWLIAVPEVNLQCKLPEVIVVYFTRGTFAVYVT